MKLAPPNILQWFSSSDNFTRIFAIGSLFVFILSMASPLLSNDSNRLNLYVHQSKAFLNGKLDITDIIDKNDNIQDTSLYQGRRFVAFPPFPALLILPVIALFGGADTVLISMLLTVMNLFIFIMILKKLDVQGQDAIWFCLALFLGTAYWTTVRGSDQVTYFAHVVCVSFVLLAIKESLYQGRGWLIGLCLGCAFLSRQMTIYSILFLLPLLWGYGKKHIRSNIISVASLLSVFGLAVLFYLYYNSIRFGNPFDTGYTHMSVNGILHERMKNHGIFNTTYIPFNFIYMFFQGPHVIFKDSLTPYQMDPYGTSITFSSPFVFFAFWAKGNKLMIYGAWIAIMLSLAHILMYYNNGWVQINAQRFSLDFMMPLIFLVALSLKQVNRKAVYAAIAYSVCINFISVAIVPLGKLFHAMMTQ